VRGLLLDEHFSVDGTQIAAWGSMKSFRARDGLDEPPSGGRNGERDFRLRQRFAIGRVCVVADRGMISAETIAGLEQRGLEKPYKRATCKTAIAR
jgi:hypothetical protein